MKTGAVITRNDFRALMADGMKMLFDENVSDLEEQLDMYKKLPSQRAFEVELGFVGMGTPSLVAELQQNPYDAPRLGRAITYIHNKFGLSVAMSYEAKEDDRYGKLSQSVIPELTTSFKVLRNMQGADLFNNAFTAVGYEPDGVALVANNHPAIRQTGGSPTTQTNLLTLPLSIAGLQQARAILRKTRSESGKITPMVGGILYVGPSQESLAWELTQSMNKPGQFAGGTQPNDINTEKGRWKVVVLDYMTDDGRYFVTADTGKTKLRWYDRKPLYTRTVIDDDVEAVKMHARARWSRGFSDWRGVTGYNPS